jgi:putative DNA primase/helicase
MGDIDSHRTGDVRAVLTPVAEWAEKNGIAVIAVSHPPKAAQAKAINAITGSLAFVAAARMVFVAVADENKVGRTLLLPVKNNIAPMSEGLGYRIEGHELERGIQTSAIAWDSDPVTVTANEAMNQGRDAGRPAKAGNDAEIFLRNRLGFGPVAAKDVVDDAEGEGFSKRTLDRAKAKLGVIVKKGNFDGGWTWHLPEGGMI